jgi:hypothetical protein
MGFILMHNSKRIDLEMKLTAFSDINLFNLLLTLKWNKYNSYRLQDANENNLLSFLSLTSTKVNWTKKLSHTMHRKDLNNREQSL